MKSTTSQGPSDQGPGCREHGRLVLDLARGRLNDSRSALAEQVREECTACRSWWQSCLGGEPATEVGRAVTEAFAGFEAPRHRAPRHWLAAAAVFFVLVLLGLPAWRQRQSARPAFGVEAAAVPTEILVEGFELGRSELVATGAQLAGKPPAVADSIFVGDFEWGNLSTWSPGKGEGRSKGNGRNG